MTDSEPGTDLVSRLPLPSHVIVLVDGRRHPGWLIGREHEESGWTALVQYQSDDGTEHTEHVPATQIALPSQEAS